ncbi:class E sortase [Streptomyces ficellus]|uniref:Class E sortase n=1 Tax=Streptomyces ficellus TaxID=1977088 RepID=A0A6I6F9G7_9ACTN|nr:class E sortase [Streptomyces ficellus]QGV79594.1 class E sortase [Streptomyces ficellus]
MRRHRCRGPVGRARAGGGQGRRVTHARPEHEHGSPWFRAANHPESPLPEPPFPEPVPEGPYAQPYADTWAPDPGYAPGRVPDDETMALRTEDTRRIAPTPAGPADPDGPASPAPERPTGGRAERRRAAKGRGRRRKGSSPPAAPVSSAQDPGRPLTRVEARRAARARKDSVGVVASRVVGEVFITFGVVMLLFVTYQLWWTNIRAGFEADQAKQGIEDAWAEGRKPDAFEPGQGFAIMYIPKLDVVVPIAEGINKKKVLDRGMVGHYAEGQLKTAMPSDKQGNFAVAGHRNTHGEPFRYINQLTPGDPIVVETQDAYYTYEMASILPQTPPSNVSVIQPVPQGSGFTRPGRYITLTTCTPEFTSTYRMIVWGKMVDERPRSKGKPDALVG